MTTIEQAQRQVEKRAMKRNPPAFPTVHNGNGLSMRDYFAAKAMHAYCSDPTWRKTMPQDETAESAYAMADQMLKARES